MVLLSRAKILRLHSTATRVHLDRIALLSGIDPAFVHGIPIVSTPSAQLLVDLGFLNCAEITTSSPHPLVTWLENAVALLGPSRLGRVFSQALGVLRQAPNLIVETPLLSGSQMSETSDRDALEVVRAHALLRAKLPAVLARCGAEPRPILMRSCIPTDIISGTTLLDQWTYVCMQLSRRGATGLLLAFKIVDDVQASFFSDDLSRWAADFVATLLAISADGGGGDPRDTILQTIRQFVRNEAERWRRLRIEVELLVSIGSLSYSSLLYAAQMNALWNRGAAGFDARRQFTSESRELAEQATISPEGLFPKEA